MLIKVGKIGTGLTTEDAIRPDLTGVDETGNQIEVKIPFVVVEERADYFIIEISEDDLAKLDQYKVQYTKV